MHPGKILPWLLGGAIAGGALLHQQHLRATGGGSVAAAPNAASDDKDARIEELESEVAMLKRENESLRSLSQGGGEVAVSPEMIVYVQEAYGLDFKSSPQVHRLEAEELRDRIAAAIEARYGPDGLYYRQQAWLWMGLEGPEDRFEGELAALKAIGTRSWFDPASGEAWVTDRYDEGSIPDQAAMVRALAQILSHQHFPPPPGWPGDEAALAREALHEGAARRLENQFLAKQALHTGFSGAKPETENRELIAHLPDFVKGVAAFATERGIPKVNRSGATAKDLQRLVHQPPQITAAFFPADLSVANPPELAATAESVMLEESMGLLGTRLWLGGKDPEAADAWRGDRYRLSAVDDLTVNLVWEVRLADPAAAERYQAAAEARVAELAGAEWQKGRKIHVERAAADIVRLVNAAG